MSQRVKDVLRQLKRRRPWVFTAPASRQYPKGGNRLSGGLLLSALKRVIKRIGLDGKVHTFRHTFISESLKEALLNLMISEGLYILLLL